MHPGLLRGVRCRCRWRGAVGRISRAAVNEPRQSNTRSCGPATRYSQNKVPHSQEKFWCHGFFWHLGVMQLQLPVACVRRGIHPFPLHRHPRDPTVRCNNVRRSVHGSFVRASSSRLRRQHLESDIKGIGENLSGKKVKGAGRVERVARPVIASY
jgi:hypothetical protein